MDKTISCVSFIHNEAKHIRECFEPIKEYVDEIILVDLDSTDSTYDECKKITDKVYRRPHLLCGDFYKQELAYRATGDWLFWVYPDERFPQNTLKSIRKLITSDIISFTAFAFMRHEYRDDVRAQYEENGKIKQHGTAESPNYQIRLIKNSDTIIYNELVHFEVYGEVKTCGLPPELYFEHRKSASEQEWDNIRTYVWMRQLIWKYGTTKVEPYKTFVESYKKIVMETQQLNIKGNRKIHLSEELWYDYDKYLGMNRLTKDEFKNTMGIEYETFIGGQR